MQGTGIGVEQQLVGIEAVAALGRMGAVGAQAVERTGREARQIAVPDRSAAFGQGQALGLSPAILGEQAELDPGRVLREHGDVRALAVAVDAQGVRPPRQQPALGLRLHAAVSISSA